MAVDNRLTTCTKMTSFYNSQYLVAYTFYNDTTKFITKLHKGDPFETCFSDSTGSRQVSNFKADVLADKHHGTIPWSLRIVSGL